MCPHTRSVPLQAVPIDEQLEQVLSQVLVEKFGAIPKKAHKAAPAAGSMPLLGEFAQNYAKNKKPWDL